MTREKNDLFKHIEEVRAAGATLLSAAASCASNPGDAAPSIIRSTVAFTPDERVITEPGDRTVTAIQPPRARHAGVRLTF